MSRTPLFGAIAAAARSSGFTMDRRAFLTRAASLAAIVACGPGAPTDSPDTDGSDSPQTTPFRVAIVGGGLAGVLCASLLSRAGVTDLVLFEASDRLGGRTYTARGFFDDGLTAELGGELIDSNHATMRALAAELGITLDDRVELTAGLVPEVFDVSGAVVPADTLLAQLSEVAPTLVADLSEAESSDAAFKTLDLTPLSEYLDNVVPADRFPELRAVLEVAYRGEFGLEISEQSALNLIYLIGTGADELALYGVSDERFHAREGSDAFVSRLADGLPDGVARTAHPVVAIAASEDEYRLVIDGPDGAFEHACDHVVLALPFTALRRVETLSAGLSPLKRQIIGSYAYGTNAKLMGVCSEPVWRTVHGASGAVTTDRPAQQFWDASVTANGPSVVVNFLGGQAGATQPPGNALAEFRENLQDLEAVFPGVAAVTGASVVRMRWATVPYIEGSYACYRPGQWAWYGLEGLSEGGLHFCGEHCSAEFQGYMEGAAATGAQVASALIGLAGLSPPSGSVLEAG
jgi:monoamine oxidase